jgi:hypothetical protein
MPIRIENHCLGIILLVAASQASAADPDDAIAECARLASTGDRILCLETALRRLSPAPQARSGAGDIPATGHPEIAAGPPAQAEAPAVAAVAARNSADRAAEIEQFGLSEAQQKQERPDSITVEVTRVSESAYGKMLITTADGQVWRQTDQARARLPEVPFNAEIRSGAAGSFFFQASSGGRAVRVRREK